MSRSGNAPLLSVEGLEKTFRRHAGLFETGDRPLPALNGLDLTMMPGEIYGLAGESGSGKSTLARVLGQLLMPDRGVIRLDGVDVHGMRRPEQKKARQRIQLIFQDPSSALSPRRRILNTLLEPLDHFGIGQPAERKGLALEALEAVGLDASALGRLPHQFSSGQRQRICIARALLARPDLLVADEAVSALDVSVQARILQLLAQLRERHGIAILLISHDLAVIRQLADRVGIMFAGRLVEQGPAAVVFEQPAHPYTRALLEAVTDPEPRERRHLTLPRPHSPAAEPAGEGCAFTTRCPHAQPHCRGEVPLTRPVHGDRDHVVECFLADTPGRDPGAAD